MPYEPDLPNGGIWEGRIDEGTPVYGGAVHIDMNAPIEPELALVPLNAPNKQESRALARYQWMVKRHQHDGISEEEKAETEYEQHLATRRRWEGELKRMRDMRRVRYLRYSISETPPNELPGGGGGLARRRRGRGGNNSDGITDAEFTTTKALGPGEREGSGTDDSWFWPWAKKRTESRKNPTATITRKRTGPLAPKRRSIFTSGDTYGQALALGFVLIFLIVTVMQVQGDPAGTTRWKLAGKVLAGEAGIQ